jgi:aspartyl/asparaginyl beta-hydroxylase (cupin superfamily)
MIAGAAGLEKSMTTVPADRPAPHSRGALWEMLEGGLRRVLAGYNRGVARRSVHGDQAFFDPAQFAWIPGVEAQWRTIRTELDSVLANEPIPQFGEITPDQAHLTTYGKWKTFFFCAYGVRVEENCRRCPETTRILQSIPGMQTAFFSILQPDMHIDPHCGPYGGVLRFHLALKVPQPASACRIRVGTETRSWTEGRSLVFDDTYEHEAWNDSTGERVVLFVDFERPLGPFLRRINRLFIGLIARSPLVQDGIKRYEDWKRRQPEKPAA